MMPSNNDPTPAQVEEWEDQQTPSTGAMTAAQALAQAVRESVAENVRGTSGPSNLATSYWDGYRAAGNEIADLLEEPALLDRYPALGALPATDSERDKVLIPGWLADLADDSEARLSALPAVNQPSWFREHDEARKNRARDERLREARAWASDLRRGSLVAPWKAGVVALDDEVTRLTALLAEQAATIEAVESALTDDRKHIGKVHGGVRLVWLVAAIRAALGSQRTEGGS